MQRSQIIKVATPVANTGLVKEITNWAKIGF
jgi:hypothetical protein